MKQSLKTLREFYGSQAAAARAMGFSAQHLSALAIAGRGPVKTERYIRLWAWMVQTGQQPDDLEFFNPKPPHSPEDSL